MSRTRPAALLAFLFTVAAAPPPAIYPPLTIVLFVADWCAPCHREVARLPELSAAAAPWRMMVVDADHPATPGRLARRVPETQRWLPADETWAYARRDLMTEEPGLPLSIAFNSSGARCGIVRGGLTPAQARALVSACAAP